MFGGKEQKVGTIQPKQGEWQDEPPETWGCTSSDILGGNGKNCAARDDPGTEEQPRRAAVPAAGRTKQALHGDSSTTMFVKHSSRPVPEQQQLNSRARLYFKIIPSSNEFGYQTDFYATGLMPQGKAP